MPAEVYLTLQTCRTEIQIVQHNSVKYLTKRPFQPIGIIPNYKVQIQYERLIVIFMLFIRIKTFIMIYITLGKIL